MDELSLIELLKQGTPAASESWGDDAFYDAATSQVVTVDTFIEGRHFSLEHYCPEDVGWKTAAAAISDVAAMGAGFRWLLTGLGRPVTTSPELIKRTYDGMLALLESLGEGLLVGGDTVASEQWLLSHTAIGVMEAGRQPGLRKLLQPGDRVFITGPHGLSAIGLWALRAGLGEAYPEAVKAHRRPVPRLAYGQLLTGLGARLTLMDTSDGLADAALKVVEASGVRVALEEQALELHEELKKYEADTGKLALEKALYGGEDFELFVGLPEAVWQTIQKDERFNFLQPVGRAEAGVPEAVLKQKSGQVVALSFNKTYQHF